MKFISYEKNESKKLNMIEWHKRLLKQMMEQFNLDSYQVVWISFLEGVVLTIIFYEFFVS
tara:strand:- start:186 stop:365 length:180 start_codon:yes stop_codon:yes gene_type:complete